MEEVSGELVEHMATRASRTFGASEGDSGKERTATSESTEEVSRGGHWPCSSERRKRPRTLPISGMVGGEEVEREGKKSKNEGGRGEARGKKEMEMEMGKERKMKKGEREMAF